MLIRWQLEIISQRIKSLVKKSLFLCVLLFCPLALLVCITVLSIELIICFFLRKSLSYAQNHQTEIIGKREIISIFRILCVVNIEKILFCQTI